MTRAEVLLANLVKHARVAFPRTPYKKALEEAREYVMFLEAVPKGVDINTNIPKVEYQDKFGTWKTE